MRISDLSSCVCSSDLHQAGVTVVIVGISNHAGASRLLYSRADDGRYTVKKVTNINAYLVPAPNVIVNSLAKPVDGRPEFISGNVADDDGQLIASSITDFGDISGNARHIIRPFLGSFEFINGRQQIGRASCRERVCQYV